MFEKQRIAFSKKEIFGNKFKPTIDSCFCTVSKLLFAGKIENDGTINIYQSINFKKEELWAYIYYLYIHNTSVSVFKSMTNKQNGKASAAQFYSTVITITGIDIDEDGDDILDESNKNQKVTPFDATTLIIFINNIIEEFGKELINPIFDYLSILLKKNVLTRLSGFTLKTNNNVNRTNNNIKIVTSNANVVNANVKFTLSLDENVNVK